jgi:general secretion pathway protein I
VKRRFVIGDSGFARVQGAAARRARLSRITNHQSRITKGFTLVELIAAFVIFALGFGVLMQILGGALRTTRQSADATQAALYAQSLLDIQGIGEPLKEGGSSGDFDNTYHWQLNVQRYQIQATPGSTMAPAMATPGKPELFQLELVVSWGNQYLRHHARFVTLRSMMPPRNGNQPSNGLPAGFG